MTCTRVYSMTGKAPHIRHIAEINRIKYPPGYFFPARHSIAGDIAITLCGHFMRNYWDGNHVSNQHTDGTPFLVECPICLERYRHATGGEPATTGSASEPVTGSDVLGSQGGARGASGSSTSSE